MPEYEFDKPHHLNRLHDELIADGITPESVRGQSDGDKFWITVPAILQPQVSAVVEAHDGAAAVMAEHWREARAIRDQKLRDSDWVGVTDTQLSDANLASWQAYRQSLRDIPQEQPDDPQNIVWPSAPSD